MDRIAATAWANRSQLYAFFGRKDAIFDAVFRAHIDAIVDAVPLSSADLPGYAIALYDAYLERPELVRLATWARLERTPAGQLITDHPHPDAHKLEAIAAAQRVGRVVASLTPADVLSLVTALSITWSPTSALVAASRDEDAAEHERRRRALAATVHRASAP